MSGITPFAEPTPVQEKAKTQSEILKESIENLAVTEDTDLCTFNGESANSIRTPTMVIRKYKTYGFGMQHNEAFDENKELVFVPSIESTLFILWRGTFM